MKISFHGAAQTVTGSKHLVTLSNGKKILLDCGMFQGMGHETDDLNRYWGFEPSEVTYLILSHAHIDHCGLIPKLVKDGFDGPVYATPATVELASILLQDSAGIQENDIAFTNKRLAREGKPQVRPLYTKDEAIAAIDRFISVDYGDWVTIEPGIEFMYSDVGHIIGSAAVNLKITEKGKITSITFSGDVGRYRDILLRSPSTFPQADYIILESTYGNSLHDELHPTVDTLLEWIEKTCIQKGGKLILPAFSVGRTQELLYALNQLEIENRLPDIGYFVDSPLSIKATGIIKSYPEYFNSRIQKVLKHDEDPFSFKGLKFINSVEESKLLNYYKEPCVIISASGMAEAGRVKHHISNNIENSRNAIVLTGYCEPNSLGGRLSKHPKEVNIFGQVHEVNAEIGQMRSMSAHGDYEDLMQFLACQDARSVKKLFLVHGEYDVQLDFKKRLLKKDFMEVEIPSMHFETGL